MLAHRYGRWIAVLLVCVACVGAGCGGGGKGGGQQTLRTMRPPKEPPHVPPRVDVALNPQLQEQARAEMNRAATSNMPIIRAHAIELMREADPQAAREYVITGLDDQQAVVRFAAALAAGELRLAETLDKVRQMAGFDPDSSVQIAARFAMHRLGDTSLSRDLEKSARSRDARTRGDTALVLGLLEEPTALNVLRPMRNDPEVAVRLQAAESMWRLRDEDGIAPLVAGTVSQFPDDQMTALMGLAAGKDRRVIEHLRGALTSDYDAISLVAARAMGKLGSDEGYGVALRGVKSRDAKLRLLAALAMGAIGRSDAQDELALLLRDNDPNVRLAAASAILQLK